VPVGLKWAFAIVRHFSLTSFRIDVPSNIPPGKFQIEMSHTDGFGPNHHAACTKTATSPSDCTLRNIVKRRLARLADTRKLKDLTRVGIDEFAIKQRHSYLTVVLDLDSGRTVYVETGKITRRSKTLIGSFGAPGPIWKRLPSPRRPDIGGPSTNTHRTTWPSFTKDITSSRR